MSKYVLAAAAVSVAVVLASAAESPQGFRTTPQLSRLRDDIEAQIATKTPIGSHDDEAQIVSKTPIGSHDDEAQIASKTPIGSHDEEQAFRRSGIRGIRRDVTPKQPVNDDGQDSEQGRPKKNPIIIKIGTSPSTVKNSGAKITYLSDDLDELQSPPPAATEEMNTQTVRASDIVNAKAIIGEVIKTGGEAITSILTNPVFARTDNPVAPSAGRPGYHGNSNDTFVIQETQGDDSEQKTNWARVRRTIGGQIIALAGNLTSIVSGFNSVNRNTTNSATTPTPINPGNGTTPYVPGSDKNPIDGIPPPPSDDEDYEQFIADLGSGIRINRDDLRAEKTGSTITISPGFIGGYPVPPVTNSTKTTKTFDETDDNEEQFAVNIGGVRSIDDLWAVKSNSTITFSPGFIGGYRLKAPGNSTTTTFDDNEEQGVSITTVTIGGRPTATTNSTVKIDFYEEQEEAQVSPFDMAPQQRTSLSRSDLGLKSFDEDNEEMALLKRNFLTRDNLGLKAALSSFVFDEEEEEEEDVFFLEEDGGQTLTSSNPIKVYSHYQGGVPKQRQPQFKKALYHLFEEDDNDEQSLPVQEQQKKHREKVEKALKKQKDAIDKDLAKIRYAVEQFVTKTTAQVSGMNHNFSLFDDEEEQEDEYAEQDTIIVKNTGSTVRGSGSRGGYASEDNSDDEEEQEDEYAEQDVIIVKNTGSTVHSSGSRGGYASEDNSDDETSQIQEFKKHLVDPMPSISKLAKLHAESLLKYGHHANDEEQTYSFSGRRPRY